MNEWQDIETAPREILVEVLNSDGDVDLAEWRHTRQCMLASVARGAGECGPGWVSSLCGYLPIDAPEKWRPLGSNEEKKP